MRVSILSKKQQELLRPLAWTVLAVHLSHSDVEGGEQRRRSGAGVIVAAARHGKHRLATVERLDLRLFVNAQHDGMLGPYIVAADDVPYLRDETQIGGTLELLLPARPQPERVPDPCMVLAHRLLSRAMPHEFQCIAPSGALTSVRVMTPSIRVSSIVRGVSVHHSSRSPLTRCSTKRPRDVPTVIG
jgi:hypothetical protein